MYILIRKMFSVADQWMVVKFSDNIQELEEFATKAGYVEGSYKIYKEV